MSDIENKVKIELSPYNGAAILAFLKEWENDFVAMGEKGTAMLNAIAEYEASFCANITNEQIDDFEAENQVNQLIGKSPKR